MRPPNMLRRAALLISICCLIPTTAPSRASDTIQLLRQRSTAVTDSARFSLSIDLHNATFITYPAQSKTYAQQMLAIALRTNDPQMKYRAYWALARYYTKIRNYPLTLTLRLDYS